MMISPISVPGFADHKLALTISQIEQPKKQSNSEGMVIFKTTLKKDVYVNDQGQLLYKTIKGEYKPYTPYKQADCAILYKINNVVYSSADIERALHPERYQLQIEMYKVLTKEIIWKVVCRNYGINIERLFTPTRMRVISEPRMVCTYLRVNVLNEYIRGVASEHGFRDRSSAYHHLKAVHSLYKSNKSFRLRMQRICLELSINADQAFSKWKQNSNIIK